MRKRKDFERPEGIKSARLVKTLLRTMKSKGLSLLQTGNSPDMEIHG
ncbi:MAG: hypothetical protein Q4D56_11950 [Bacteroides sp.]|nr:hypothetical protein [Bacteroides sp.]